ncbi:hypothetical protein GCM10010123_35940 [Pilimelia anulata]|uniref:DUF418 domain-containing protein n=1 Tax=Pilimelia anulata TaxID=53371 RepID=A0A8J3FBR3_9ACTN|nr:DUF418 domain-containing protein [Pilimelia anulata]GGK02775.1 hypothetical protein GCM10010123_35940 [Pilimelia anulata]
MTQDTLDGSAPGAAVSPGTGDGAAPGTARLVHVDALRGLALLGILMVNIGYFASDYKGTGVLAPEFDRPIDATVAFVVDLVCETKFYLLFSFLFGYSLTLQMTSATRRGTPFVPRFLRRLLGLFVLGALHAVLLFQGDILMLYASLGLVLLLLHRIPGRVAAGLAGALLVAGVHYYGYWATIAWHLDTPNGVDAREVRDWAEAAHAVYRSGASDIIAQHLVDFREMLSVLLEFQAPAVLAMFLVGMLAGRARFLADPARHRRLLGWIIAGGAFVGIPGAILYAFANAHYVDTALELFAISYGYLASPALAAAYGAAAVLLFHGIRPLGRLFAPAGRMALSNYLFQSLFAAFVFTGYGLGLMGRVSPLAAVLTGLGLFAVQLAFSAWWLGRHPYGPVEWGLRALSYAEVPPWRRRADGPAGPRPGGAHRPGVPR